ncbi:MAG: dephospho-CoA kinase [Endomicrobiales bacterium]
MRKDSLVIGLTGGIASGKSTVLAAWGRYGARVIDVDTIARSVVRPGTTVLKNIVRTFGKTILLANGSLDRAKLSKLIFADDALRRALEKITHPAISAQLRAEIRRHKRRTSVPVLVVEVPLLYEAGLEDLFDAVVVVWVSAGVERQRLIARDNIGPTEAGRRIKAQYPLSRKKALADYVICNNGSRTQVNSQVRTLLKSLTNARK